MTMQITYQPATGSPVVVSGIYDAQYVLAQGTEEAGVEVTAPAVFLRLASLPTDPEVDNPLLTIEGLAYRVAERRAAGLGSILLVLRRV